MKTIHIHQSGGPDVSSPGILSRRHFLGWAGGSLAAAMLLPGCTLRPVPGIAAPGSGSAAPLPEPAEADLDFKIGQMLMVGFRGLEVAETDFIVRDIRERHLGGVVLFDYDVPSQQPVRNIASPAQLQALVTSLQSAAATPLLVAVDHEGGIITRLKEKFGFPASVTHQSLGRLDNPETTTAEAAQMAGTLAAAGINLNLAPVVDLCLNPDNPIIARYERCFSADPDVVTTHALRFIEAHHQQQVLCTLKHFPGHGSSREDSHQGLVDVSQTWSELELEPYARLIEAGQVDAIMTAHVFNANWDEAYPATLSPAVITTLLREKLGYDGVVISDDMQMGAIVQYYGFETALQKAIEAGVDILAFANNSVYEEDVASRAIGFIKGLVDAGTISKARIDESYRRIRQLKTRLAAS